MNNITGKAIEDYNKALKISYLGIGIAIIFLIAIIIYGVLI